MYIFQNERTQTHTQYVIINIWDAMISPEYHEYFIYFDKNNI